MLYNFITFFLRRMHDSSAHLYGDGDVVIDMSVCPRQPAFFSDPAVDFCDALTFLFLGVVG